MKNTVEQARQAIADHIHMSSNQMDTNLQALHEITRHIEAFHSARAGIYLETFEKMSGTTDFQALLLLQQEFTQSLADNFLSHSKAMTETLARSAFYVDCPWHGAFIRRRRHI